MRDKDDWGLFSTTTRYAANFLKKMGRKGRRPKPRLETTQEGWVDRFRMAVGEERCCCCCCCSTDPC
jgi:hypothetical protein